MKELLAIAGVVVFFFVVGFVMTFVGSQAEVASLMVGEHSFAVDIARTPQEHARGLSGRASLSEDRGMLFQFSVPSRPSFWMKGMQFPLDILWIRDGVVIGVAENLPSDNSEMPAIYQSSEQIDAVLEINAGLIEKLNIKIGDRVRMIQ